MSLDLVTLALAKKYTDEKAGGGDSGYTLPVGGEELGGVKNGGNVVINEDGTMTAPVSDSSQNGEDGFSPIAAVIQTEDGATITITDKTGTTTATVTNGKDGKDGEDGTPGTTPHIGENGNWWIGDTDTGVSASGTGVPSGSGGAYTWRLIKRIELEESVKEIAPFTTDDAGNEFNLKGLRFVAYPPAGDYQTGFRLWVSTRDYHLSGSNSSILGTNPYIEKGVAPDTPVYEEIVGYAGCKIWRLEGDLKTQTLNGMGNAIQRISVSLGNSNVQQYAEGTIFEFWGCDA